MLQKFPVTILLICLALASRGTVHTVTTTNFTGSGSLSQLVTQANNGDSIVFSPSLLAGGNSFTIEFDSQIIIYNAIHIAGLGAGKTVFTPAAGYNDRAIQFWNGSWGSLSHVTIDGFTGGAGSGPAVYGLHYDLISCEIINNTSGGPAVVASSQSTISNCFFGWNSQTSGTQYTIASALHMVAGTLENCTFYQNSALSAWPGQAATAEVYSTPVTNCTFKSNYHGGSTSADLVSDGYDVISKTIAYSIDGPLGSAGTFSISCCVVDVIGPNVGNLNLGNYSIYGSGSTSAASVINLDYHGGSTRCLELGSASNAIDLGTCAGTSYDQRGLAANGPRDAGAFEFGGLTPYLQACTQLATPGNTGELNVQDGSVVLQWDTVFGAQSYKIRYKIAGTSNWNITWKHWNQGRKTITGLSPGTAYKWTVQAFCSGTSSSISPQDGFITLVQPCTIPASIQIDHIAQQQAKVSWNAVSGAVKYQIAWRELGASTWNTSYKHAPWTHHWIQGLTPGTTYEYKMKTHCQYGATTGTFWSPIQTFTTTSPKSLLTDQISEGRGSFHLFPNPAAEAVNIIAPTSFGSASIVLLDCLGQPVFRLEMKDRTMELNVAHLPPGAYFMRMESNDSALVQRLIIE